MNCRLPTALLLWVLGSPETGDDPFFFGFMGLTDPQSQGLWGDPLGRFLAGMPVSRQMTESRASLWRDGAPLAVIQPIGSHSDIASWPRCSLGDLVLPHTWEQPPPNASVIVLVTFARSERAVLDQGSAGVAPGREEHHEDVSQ
jgi:hypothetical protein